MLLLSKVLPRDFLNISVPSPPMRSGNLNTAVFKNYWAAMLHFIYLFYAKEIIFYIYTQLNFTNRRVSLVAQRVKNLPEVEETQVQFLDWENPLEKRMPSHCSILDWRIPWTEEPGWLHSIESQRVGHDWTTSTFTICTNRIQFLYPILKF